jgi:hypothetical protein
MIGEDDELPGNESADGSENLGDPKRVAARNKKAKAREDLRKRFMAKLLSDREGREWVWHLLEFCKVYQSTFIAGDTHAMCINEGQRNVGLMILSEIPPDALAQMLKESGDYNG